MKVRVLLAAVVLVAQVTVALLHHASSHAPVVMTTAGVPPVQDDLHQLRQETEHASRSYIRVRIRTAKRVQDHSRRSQPAPKITSVAVPTTSYGVWQAVAACESGGDWHINTGNGFYGGLQITAGNAAHYGFARPDLLSVDQQVALGRLILRDQGPGAWPVCGPRAGLRPGM